MRLNPAISKIIAIIMLIVILIIVAAAFMLPSAPTTYTVEYDNPTGTITINSDDFIPEAVWTANISYEDSDGYSHTKFSNLPVALEPDGHSCTVKDDSLINMDNDIYTIELKSATQASLYFSFTVNDHEYTSEEMLAIWICIGLAVLVVALMIIRRLVRGY